MQHHDWLPTFVAAAGDPDIAEKLKRGYAVGEKTFKVHIDGYNLLPYLTGEVDKSPRQGFVYFSDDGDVPSEADVAALVRRVSPLGTVSDAFRT